MNSIKKNSPNESGFSRLRLSIALTLAGCALVFAVLSFGQSKEPARPPGKATPASATAISKAAVSFDGDLRDLPQTGPATKRVFEERTRHKIAPKVEQIIAPDRALQPPLPAAPAPTPSASFKGLDFDGWGAGWPPDTTGDVGPNHYIQAVNTSIGIYNKTGTRLAAFTFDTFFDGTGTPCDNLNAGDPNVNYDPIGGRYIISDFAFDTDSSNNPVGPYYQCFAVSKTSDPISGGWWLYAILTDQTSFPDYPRIGVWPDGIYMSANLFDAGGSYTGTRAWAFNREDMESGGPVRQIMFNNADGNSFAMIPSNFRGTPPPPGTPNYFIWYQENFPQFTGNTLKVHKFTITDWATMTASFSPATNVSVQQYREAPYLAPYVPQLGGEPLDSLGDRLMMQNQYRNLNGVESLWNLHTVIAPASGPQTALRWYQLNVTGGTIRTAPVQQSTYSPDTNYRWMGSLAVDRAGNMAMGYSVSSAAMFPAVRYSGRLAADPANQLPQTESSFVEGGLSQTGGFNRWGDYSSMSVDPTDDCTFWYTQEYYDTTIPAPPYAPSMNWQTRIGSFKFPTCAPTVPPLILANAVSRKTHGPQGAFNVNLPTTGTPGVECRAAQPAGTHQFALTFSNPLTAVTGVTSSCGTATGAINGSDAFNYNVTVTGCSATAQVITLTLSGVQDNQGNTAASIALPVNLLLGDTNGDGAVNSGDTVETRDRSGSLADADNFRSDVNLDGTINGGDTVIVRAHAGSPP